LFLLTAGCGLVQITTVFNLFITYGDLFLPQPSDYDDLYYELIRDAKAIETFYYYGSSSHTTAHSPPHTPPHARGVGANTSSLLFAVDRYDRAGTAQNLENMNTIIRHFTSKIDQWEAANAQNFISTPAQVTSLHARCAMHLRVVSLVVSRRVVCVRACVRWFALCCNWSSRSLQVMELIRTNYETLKLTLQDDLDSYDAYLENPREVEFCP
jgi:hypothetical protein